MNRPFERMSEEHIKEINDFILDQVNKGNKLWQCSCGAAYKFSHYGLSCGNMIDEHKLQYTHEFDCKFGIVVEYADHIHKWNENRVCSICNKSLK